MTVIVGMEDGEGGFIMGADSFLGNHHTQQRVGEQKLAWVDDVLFGFSGSVRMGQLVRYRLEIPDHPSDMSSDEWVATKLSDALKDCFEGHDFAKKKDGRSQGGFFLVGYRGGIYEAQPDYDLSRLREGYTATGAGWAVALGALRATPEEDPLARVYLALEAACHHSPWCEPPLQIEEG